MKNWRSIILKSNILISPHFHPEKFDHHVAQV